MSELDEMNRIRAARGLEPLRAGMSSSDVRAQLERDSMFERVAAARCYIDRACRTEEHARRVELFAFMSIFHPEVSAERVREMAI